MMTTPTPTPTPPLAPEKTSYEIAGLTLLNVTKEEGRYVCEELPPGVLYPNDFDLTATTPTKAKKEALEKRPGAILVRYQEMTEEIHARRAARDRANTATYDLDESLFIQACKENAQHITINTDHNAIVSLDVDLSDGATINAAQAYYKRGGLTEAGMTLSHQPTGIPLLLLKRIRPNGLMLVVEDAGGIPGRAFYIPYTDKLTVCDGEHEGIIRQWAVGLDEYQTQGVNKLSYECQFFTGNEARIGAATLRLDYLYYPDGRIVAKPVVGFSGQAPRSINQAVSYIEAVKHADYLARLAGGDYLTRFPDTISLNALMFSYDPDPLTLRGAMMSGMLTLYVEGRRCQFVGVVGQKVYLAQYNPENEGDGLIIDTESHDVKVALHPNINFMQKTPPGYFGVWDLPR